jgi:hypothetical protein
MKIKEWSRPVKNKSEIMKTLIELNTVEAKGNLIVATVFTRRESFNNFIRSR